MLFLLGTHEVHWLQQTDVPLFISYGRLRLRTALPRARGAWCLDSRGFSELREHGQWTISARDYAAAAWRYAQDIGRLQWAAPQDWMCEPLIRRKTGLSIAEHQARTIASVLELRSLEPRVQWVPVLQGWELGDYLEHVEGYARAGFDLLREPIIGVGTLCRRQATSEAENIVQALRRLKLRLHGFGLKILGLQQVGGLLDSADSMAWSFNARREQRPLCARTATHKNCANCLPYALEWRRDLLRKTRPSQARLVVSRVQQLRLAF